MIEFSSDEGLFSSGARVTGVLFSLQRHEIHNQAHLLDFPKRVYISTSIRVAVSGGPPKDSFPRA